MSNNANQSNEATITLKTGRNKIHITACGTALQVMADTTSSESGSVSRPRNGISVTAEGKKGNRRFSLANINVGGHRVDEEDDGENGFAIEARYPGGTGPANRIPGSPSGRAPRPRVFPIQTMLNKVYQVAPQLPALLTPAAIAAARTPSQRAILAHPVFSQLVHEHTFGGGLVFNGASVAMNAFVGVSNIVLPGARIGNKAIAEYQAIIAGGVYGNGVVTDKAFVHSGARVQDNARVGDEAFIDQRTWIGGKITVGGRMNLVTDDSGHLILGGFGNLVGAFDIIGAGKLMLGSHAYMKQRQIAELISSCQI
jgi:carbonic anhydrase/acetyltransferase-like protein (isoleucine patch superfamily)